MSPRLPDRVRGSRPVLALALAVLASALAPAALASAAEHLARTDTARLEAIAGQARLQAEALRGPRWAALRAKQAGPMSALLADPRLDLVGVAPSGRPLFYTTHNVVAAQTSGTDAVWPGGWTGLGLTGAGGVGELGIWDGGIVRTSHQEFGGRVSVADGNTNVNFHATHVAGTMVAAGTDAAARGMAFEGVLDSYYWDYDESEMALAAGDGLLLSNHSYGWIAGWIYGYGGDANWYWFGDVSVSETEDPGFGFYAGGTAQWDAIAHAAPHYLIVKSAGNDRDDFGPGAGQGHYYWDPGLNDWAWSTATRDADGGPDGYDSIGYRGNAKNILTVGAVADIAGGWTAPPDVVASAFTSWGPTDDGRIKPDLVANGVGLYSSLSGADDEYGVFSGTSMAAPTVSGSLYLVLQQYKALVRDVPRASTLKAIALHTANEAGPAPGPDYMFGWGLLNTAEAALLVADHADGGARVLEALLEPGAVDTYRFWHDGTGDLVVTVAWTDPAGTPPGWSVDPPARMLVHDLDLRVVRESDDEVFQPWVLDPADPAAPATRGDNDRDNVEQVDASGAGAGVYRVEVSHAGALGAGQAYSLVQTGLIPVPTAAPPSLRPVRLLHAAPNPFNPRTEIALASDRGGEARVAVYDARGRRVATLHDGPLGAGEHRLAWDGRGDGGQAVAAGVYLVRMEAGGTTDVLRISLVK